MAYLNYGIKDDSVYNLGSNAGYFIALLLFASVFYLILNFFNKLPETARYYHVLSLVILVYIARFVVLRFKK